MAAVNASGKYTHFSGVDATLLKVDGVLVSGAYVEVTDATTYTVLAANSDKRHIMPNLTADCVITMPAEADGLRFEFTYGGGAEDAHDWQFDTGSDTNYYIGGLSTYDDDDGSMLTVYSDGDSNSIVNVLTPNCGTTVTFLCTGTTWYIDGTVVSGTDTAVTFADQS